jgi:hypothetical protein
MAKQDDYTRYTIRIPTPLYERVKEAAGEASVNSLIVSLLDEKFPAPKEATPMKAAFQRLYRLMDWIQSAESEQDQDMRLREANDTLASENAGVVLKFSSTQDERGRRDIFMSTDNSAGINASEVRRLGPPSWEPGPKSDD